MLYGMFHIGLAERWQLSQMSEKRKIGKKKTTNKYIKKWTTTLIGMIYGNQMVSNNAFSEFYPNFMVNLPFLSLPPPQTHLSLSHKPILLVTNPHNPLFTLRHSNHRIDEAKTTTLLYEVDIDCLLSHHFRLWYVHTMKWFCWSGVAFLLTDIKFQAFLFLNPSPNLFCN